MKVLFTVQGEGRGHLTQALAVWDILSRHRHQLVAVLAGVHGDRSLPDYFEHGLPVPVESVPTPGFALKAGRGVDVFSTLRGVMRNLGAYRASLDAIDAAIRREQPDLIINFLEPLMGLYNLLNRHRIPVITVGHQFMMEHPAFPRTRRYWIQQFGMRRFVRLAAAGSTRLALSFYEAADLSHRKLFVCPPLLRPELFRLAPGADGRFVLCYVLNHGYAADVHRWHVEHPDVELHCFYDRPGAPPIEQVDPTLTFHAINGTKFLEMMARCRAIVCMAGVESISEAGWLGKPLLMVPVENHVEQFLNTLDAGPGHGRLGIADTWFNISRLLDNYPLQPNTAFRNWVSRAETTLMRVIKRVTTAGDPAKGSVPADSICGPVPARFDEVPGSRASRCQRQWTAREAMASSSFTKSRFPDTTG